ncbi:MAG: PKD domain-containing protein [Methanoregula sp.]|jgi:PKD repeat protein|uniref:PKD domain-containing protein n=1 Tax=Methanoregula sp. TaxID=2052170 RepID=UPI0025E7EA07|nr:PKD domain-containing protein [Methanoregula sp.]MCK9630142.1 PKD domain-containing protein [Methanoregula sp.]
MMRSSKFFLYAGLVVLLLALAVPGASASGTTQPGYITVGLAPVAQFDAHYAFTTIPTKVIFTDNSLGSTPMTWEWDFGDGATSTDQNPSHMYLKRGTYSVTLTVKNPYGTSTAIKKDYITIGVSPRAAFVADPTSGGTPLNVAFTDQSTGQVTAWQWDFGDGQGSTEQNPVHTYWTSGVYRVILTVSNEFGSSDVAKNDYITVSGDLVSKFIADPSSGKAPLAVMFTDKSLGSPTEWAWDFGDGMTSTGQYPSHTFTSAGSYDVKLTITRNAETASSTQTLNVGGVPNADFAGAPTHVNTDEAVAFTDKSGNSPTSWSWDFGDTATSTVQNPSHAYQVKGIYTVSLTARNANGRDIETKTGYINVGIAPKAEFIPVIVPYQQYKVPMSVNFIDQSTGIPTSWSWDFGDGSTSTDQNPTHRFMKEGTYTVTLTATNNFGSDTKVRTDLITVGGGAAVDFVADKTTVGVGRIVTFTDLSTSNPTLWVWDFGDGTTGTGAKPDHVYRTTGVYDVTLTASNPYLTNSRTKNQYITVLAIPKADFVADKTRGGAPMAVSFTDKSGNSPTSWSWDFGDGSTSSEQNPTHTYTTLGTYTVSLTASNNDGKDIASKANYIMTTLAPVAEFGANRQVGKAPFVVEFTDLSSNEPTKWKWDFGDGTSSSEQNPRHIYLFEGSYDVSLTVTNQYGSDTMFKTGTSAAATPGATTSESTVAPTPEATVPGAAAAAPAAAAASPTTQAPLPAMVSVIAAAFAMLAIAVAHRK